MCSKHIDLVVVFEESNNRIHHGNKIGWFSWISYCFLSPFTAAMVETVLNEERFSQTSVQSVCACRICQTPKSREDLTSPCHCKGSLGKVHVSCLERWLNISGREYCEICRFHFTAQKTRRYSMCQSIRIWVKHPRHRDLLRADLIVIFILTVVTVGLVSISAFGVRHFVSEGLRMGINSVWTGGVITFFLVIVIIGYLGILYFILRDHVVPWYRWWSRCMIIRLILPTTDLHASVTNNCISPSTRDRRENEGIQHTT